MSAERAMDNTQPPQTETSGGVYHFSTYPCPYCDPKCPHCGRPYRTQPYVPNPYPYPFWYELYPIWSSTSTHSLTARQGV